MYKYYESGIKNQSLTLKEKLLNISFSYLLFILLVAATGTLMLYSAAGGSWSPWAYKHLVRFLFSFGIMLIVALIDIRFWMKYAYLFYAAALVLLIGVEIMGTIGMGAKRWIDIGPIRVQPSEVMKITLVLALARYFHGSSLQDITSIPGIILPIGLVLIPAVLILKQPDLGTALMLIMTTGAIFFAIGVDWWKFAIAGGSVLTTLPIIWLYMKDYQKKRVLTFLNPESDPLGAGYHITQSKITLGSGGLFGKGFLNGTQSHLNFLPEKHTDFIFTMLSEEFGLLGGITIIALNVLLIAYSYAFALRSTSYFGKVLAIGLTTNFFLYLFINIAMVIGLVPVVGVPLPLISYGGTVMLSIMVSFGLILSVHIHRNTTIGKGLGLND